MTTINIHDITNSTNANTAPHSSHWDIPHTVLYVKGKGRQFV